MQELEAPRKALGETAPDQKLGRPRQHHLELPSAPGVLVPQAFDGLRPARRLLDLVQNEKRALRLRSLGHEPCPVPLLGDPLRTAQGGLVGAGETVVQPGPLRNLHGQGRLADLPRPGDDLEETPRLAQTGEQFCRLRPLVGQITQHTA